MRIHIDALITGILAKTAPPPAFSLRDDADGQLAWAGIAMPTQAEIDRAARAANRRGWNGTYFDLYRGSERLGTAGYSEGALDRCPTCDADERTGCYCGVTR